MILEEDRIICGKLLLETIMAIVQVFFRGLLCVDGFVFHRVTGA